MKVLMAGDVHGNTSHMITLLDNAQAQGCDRMFQLGDFLFGEHIDGGTRFLDDVNRHARQRNIDVYWLDGNHDKTSKLMADYGNQRDHEGFVEVRPRIKYAPRGHFWTWANVSFIALGGAYSVDKDYRLWLERQRGKTETYWFSEEEMSDEEMGHFLEAAPERIDVILAHDKPRSSSPRWNRKDIQECWPNQDRLERALQRLKPKMYWHGHLHYRYSDLVRHDRGFTEVIGLDADPAATDRNSSRGSWEVLDLTNEDALRHSNGYIGTPAYKDRVFCDMCGEAEEGSVYVYDDEGFIIDTVTCKEHKPYPHPPL